MCRGATRSCCNNDAENEADEESTEDPREEAHISLAYASVKEDAVVIHVKDADAAVVAMTNLLVNINVFSTKLEEALALCANNTSFLLNIGLCFG